jgi:hypothetical protein
LIETGYNGSSDFVSLYTAGNNVANATAKITMLAGGNVGIGTSSPAVKLHSSASYAAPTGGIDANVQILTSNTSGASGINMLASNASVSFLHFGDTDAANVGQIAYTHVNDNMLFVVGGAERVRLTTNGLTFNGDTAAANALDDYEEGTWTMGLSFGGGSTGVTYSANTGTYTKIGRQVTVNGVLVLTSKGSSTGSVLITGLPFTIANFGANYAAAVLRIENISFANQFQAYGGIGSTVVAIDEITEAGVNGSLTDADFANNSTVMISLTYFV